jgi:small-conductance mechanosensitive channel
MDRQQAINQGIYREFREKGIEFAYPTRKILLTREKQDILHGA